MDEMKLEYPKIIKHNKQLSVLLLPGCVTQIITISFYNLKLVNGLNAINVNNSILYIKVTLSFFPGLSFWIVILLK